MLSFTVLTIVLIVTTASARAEYYEKCSEVPVETYIAIEDDCSSFIYCGDGEDSYKDQCPEGSYFDEAIPDCVVDVNNICPRNVVDETLDNVESEEHELEGVEDIQEAMVTMAATVPHEISITTTTTSRPVCDRHVDAFYPHHKRCEYYYKCVAGFLTISRCNFFYAWDHHENKCLPRQMAKCYGSSAVKLRKFM